MKKGMMFLLFSFLVLSMLQIVIACGDDDDDDDDDNEDPSTDDDDDDAEVPVIPHEEHGNDECASCHAAAHDNGNYPEGECTDCHSYAS